MTAIDKILINKTSLLPLHKRFRGFLPILIDLEASGLNPKRNAILELAAFSFKYDDSHRLTVDKIWHEHFEPFPGAIMDKEALDFIKIDPYHPFRFAKPEKECLESLNNFIMEEIKLNNCKRGILVAHNAWFDLHFLNVGFKRAGIKSPLHKFSSIDTASLTALFYGHTVLAEGLKLTKMGFNPEKAHSALYDATKTAQLFCRIVNDLYDLVNDS